MPQENVELALNELAANTRQLRTSTGSSLSELAKRAGLTKSEEYGETHRALPRQPCSLRRVSTPRMHSAAELRISSRPGRLQARTRVGVAPRATQILFGPQRTQPLGSVARIAAGLSRDELAERAGIGRTTLLYIESGRTQLLLRFAVRLATALNRSITDFLDAAASGLLGSGALSSLASRCSGTERIVAWRRRSRQ